VIDVYEPGQAADEPARGGQLMEHPRERNRVGATRHGDGDPIRGAREGLATNRLRDARYKGMKQ
jgi:hypothetical protein